jgi:hypothetical protein
MIHLHALMILYEKQNQQVYIQICKFILAMLFILQFYIFIYALVGFVSHNRSN